jgi:hypothetical protein
MKPFEKISLIWIIMVVALFAIWLIHDPARGEIAYTKLMYPKAEAEYRQHVLAGLGPTRCDPEEIKLRHERNLVRIADLEEVDFYKEPGDDPYNKGYSEALNVVHINIYSHIESEEGCK